MAFISNVGMREVWLDRTKSMATLNAIIAHNMKRSPPTPLQPVLSCRHVDKREEEIAKCIVQANARLACTTVLFYMMLAQTCREEKREAECC